MAWTGAHSAFARESIIATLRAFRAHLMFGRNDAISDRIFNLYEYGFSIRNSIVLT